MGYRFLKTRCISTYKSKNKKSQTFLPRADFWAEKIESQDDHQFAISNGFSQFQGYFFSKPTVVAKKVLPHQPTIVARLLFEMNRPKIILEKIQALLDQDVSLSYKLLYFVNSINLDKDKIATTPHALIFLGT